MFGVPDASRSVAGLILVLVPTIEIGGLFLGLGLIVLAWAGAACLAAGVLVLGVALLWRETRERWPHPLPAGEGRGEGRLSAP